MEQVHLEISLRDDISDMEEYTNPHAPYAIVSVYPDNDVPDIRICRTIGDIIDNAKDMYRTYHEKIVVEEIINYEDYDEDTIDYIVSCFKGIEVDSVPVECEVEWENLDDPDSSCKFTTTLDYGINME